MKKHTIMTIAAAAALAASAAAPFSLEWEAKYLAEARAYVTNDAASVAIAYFPRSTNAAYNAELDAILAAKPPLCALSYKTYASEMPLTAAAARERYAASYPTLAKVAANGFSLKGLSVAEKIEFNVERLPTVAGKKSLDQLRSTLGTLLGQQIVKTLRRQGKAVTTGADGVSPVKAYADRISAALDAPRFAGLAEILAEMGVKAKLDLSRFGTAQEANALIDEIMAGDKNLTPRAEYVIATGLGVAKYNEFVERYNGGAR